MKNKIKYIAFDADDTLWINEPIYQKAEKKLKNILSAYVEIDNISKEHYKTESTNISIYGYGVKGFTLSMIETAIKLTEGKIEAHDINCIISIGKEMLDAPVDLLNNVESVLKKLSHNYKLVVATKGDLLDQQNKLEKSGLEKYFHHIEVMSEKHSQNYINLLGHLEIKPEEFLMIGNSLKSDIIPVLEIGSEAVHIPYKTTWQHENVDENELKHLNFHTVTNIKEILNFF